MTPEAQVGVDTDVVHVRDLRVAMVYHSVGTRHVNVTVIDENGMRSSTALAPVAEVAQPVERLSRMLRAPTRFAPSDLAEALHGFSTDWGRRLLPDLELLGDYDVLVIVPHHFLHDLPFQVIRTGAGNECLGNRFGISYCSSATQFERAVGRNPLRLDGISAWQFSLTGNAPDTAPKAPALCYALGMDVIGGDTRYGELARACADRFPNSHLGWGRDLLKSPLAQTADVVCLVCHGVTNDHRYDDSGLLLANDPRMRSEISLVLHLGQQLSFRDLPFSYFPPQLEVAPAYRDNPLVPELMTIKEVRTLVETQAQLVMLLGCSTATGQLRSGDSYASLAYQWLQAGAVSVLGHQWEADFPFVAGWMPVFLDNWIMRRQPKAIAVRESLNQVLEDGLVPRDALHLWAAITLLGDWI